MISNILVYLVWFKRYCHLIRSDPRSGGLWLGCISSTVDDTEKLKVYLKLAQRFTLDPCVEMYLTHKQLI